MKCVFEFSAKIILSIIHSGIKTMEMASCAVKNFPYRCLCLFFDKGTSRRRSNNNLSDSYILKYNTEIRMMTTPIMTTTQ